MASVPCTVWQNICTSNNKSLKRRPKELNLFLSHGLFFFWALLCLSTAAAEEGFDNTARLLIDLGASASARSHLGDTALHFAALNGKVSTIHLLVNEYKANINCTNVYHDTPIFVVAAEYGHARCVKLLHRLGADVNLRDVHGFHPLYIAACRGREDMVRMLVTELGCNPEVLTKNGEAWVS